MNDPKKNMNYLIDKYYNETDDEIDMQNKDIQQKLASSLDKMDAIKDMNFDIDVNILETINNAQEIRGRKKSLNEALGFGALCISLLLTIGFIVLKFELFVQIYYAEIIIFTLMPFIIIPFAAYARMKEGNL